MIHIPIVDSQTHNHIAEFSHINRNAKAGDWTKEKLIYLDHFKINIFMQGDFSVVVKDKRYNPVYGDLCVLPPNTLHYGQILHPTHTDYYQLDIGTDTLNGIPGGKELLIQLRENAEKNDTFLRPDKASVNALIQLLKKAEAAVAVKDFTSAFIHISEILVFINSLYKNKTTSVMQVLSRLTTNVIKYIEQNWQNPVTIAEIASCCDVSPSYASRQFKKEVGVTIHSYLNTYRISKSTELLKSNSVTQTAYICGFADSSHFISVFKKAMGVTPSDYKNKRGCL